jgi:hypothetical protein
MLNGFRQLSMATRIQARSLPGHCDGASNL